MAFSLPLAAFSVIASSFVSLFLVVEKQLLASNLVLATFHVLVVSAVKNEVILDANVKNNI